MRPSGSTKGSTRVSSRAVLARLAGEGSSVWILGIQGVVRGEMDYLGPPETVCLSCSRRCWLACPGVGGGPPARSRTGSAPTPLSHWRAVLASPVTAGKNPSSASPPIPLPFFLWRPLHPQREQGGNIDCLTSQVGYATKPVDRSCEGSPSIRLDKPSWLPGSQW